MKNKWAYEKDAQRYLADIAALEAERDDLARRIAAIVECVREAANDGEDDIFEALGAVCNIAEGRLDGKHKEIG